MKPTLIFFIDALPYEARALVLGNIQPLTTSVRLLPEVGYSSNQHWAMFAKKLPDDLGYFTDFSLVEDYADLGLGFYLQHNNLFNTLFNFIGNKFGITVNNIPLGLKKIFINQSIYPFSNKENFQKTDALFHSFKFQKTARDSEIDMLDELARSDMADKTFVVINSIDHLGHIKVPMGEEYMPLASRILIKIKGVVDRFYHQYGEDVNVILLSDHGMSSVKSHRNLVLEKMFGPQRMDRYIYFLDAVLCRIWLFDKGLGGEIANYLSSLNCGEILDMPKRKHFGLTNENFGEMIFILNPGAIFKPNYFGYGLRGIVRGMHGYLPEEDMQHGLFVCNGEMEYNHRTVRNLDVLDLIKQKVGQEP